MTDRVTDGGECMIDRAFTCSAIASRSSECETVASRRPERRSVGAKVRKMMQQESLVARRNDPKEGGFFLRCAHNFNCKSLKKEFAESRSKALLKRVRTKKLTKQDQIMDSDSHSVPVDFSDTERRDIERLRLMLLTRKAGPLTIFFDVRHLRDTVLPAVLLSYNALMLCVAYSVAASTTRLGIWPVPHEDDSPVGDDVSALLGMELLVTFTLVFYFGYCYNRFWEQYALAMACKASIIDSVILVRASRMPKADVLDLHRYLNLAQVAGYVALSVVYTRNNLFDSFARLHNLLPAETTKELSRINQLRLEGGTGAAVYNEYCLYSLELINHAAERGELSASSHLVLQEQIVRLRDSITGLFNLHYTVIPFCYVHLVSFLVNAYLILFSMAKGRFFTPNADLTRGCVFPCLAAFFLSISCLGLIEIGGRMQNPVGNDTEDFAILSFLNLTIDASKHATRTPETERAKAHAKWLAMQSKAAAGLSVSTKPAQLPRPNRPSPVAAAASGGKPMCSIPTSLSA